MKNELMTAVKVVFEGVYMHRDLLIDWISHVQG